MILATPQASCKIHFEHWPVVWLWPVSLVFMQLTLMDLDGFQLTLSVVICHAMQLTIVMLYWLGRPSDHQVVLALAVILYTLLLGLFAQDGVEFARSLAHILNLLVMVVICFNARLGQAHELRRSLAVFCLVATGAGLFIIAQAVSFNLLGDFRLAGALGRFAPLGPGNEVYLASPLSALPRANGFYSEPSVAGWFMSFATALALAGRRHYPVLSTLAAIVCALAAMATLSLTGVIGSITVLTGYVLFVRDRLEVKLFWLALAGSGAAIALSLAWQLGILDRLRHFHTPGTSIYFRLNAPLALIAESLDRFPLGYPLGQTVFIASRDYYINWDKGSQTNIDNTLLMFVFYFGLLGVLFNATYLVQMARYLLLKRHAVGLIMLSLLIGLTTTGAGWAHQFVLMIGYAILIGRYLYGQRAPGPRRVASAMPALIPPRSAAWPARAIAPAAPPRAA
jgi:hypothetical protein